MVDRNVIRVREVKELLREYLDSIGSKTGRIHVGQGGPKEETDCLQIGRWWVS